MGTLLHRLLPAALPVRGVLVLGVMVLSELIIGCGAAHSTRRAYFYSFETGLEGWRPRGLDTALGSGDIAWSIAPSVDRASDGQQSLKLYLENFNDAGKIIVERAFGLAANRHYVVTISFDLGSADWGDFNLFTIIAGALPASPQVPQDLAPAFQGSTGNGRGSDVGYVWLRKIVSARVQTGASGQAVVVVGIWGTWETARTYYLDSLSIEFAEGS